MMANVFSVVVAILVAGSFSQAGATHVDTRCKAFPTPVATNTDVDAAINDRLRTLRAPSIPANQFRRMMQKMRRDLQPVRKVAADILANERDYIAGHASRNEVIEKSQSTREALGQLASLILQKPDLDLSDRRQLEAIRLLRDRTRRVESHTVEELAQVVPPAEEPPPEPPTEKSLEKLDEGNPRSEHSRSAEDGDAASSKSAKKEGPGQTQHDESLRESSRMQEQDLEILDEASEPKRDARESTPDQKSQTSNIDKQRSSQSKPNRDDKNDQAADMNDEASTEEASAEKESEHRKPTSKRSKKDSGGSEKSEEHGSSSQDGKDPSEGQGKGTPSKSGNTGDQQSGESRGQEANGSASKSAEGEGQGSGESQSGSSESASGGQESASQKTARSRHGESDSDPAGNEGAQGASKGGGPDQQSLLDRLSDFFKDTLTEQILKSEKPTRERDREPEKSAKDAVEAAKRWDELARSQLDLRPKEQNELAPLSDFKKRKVKDQRDPLPALGDANQTELLLKLIRRLSAQALRNYRSSGAFATGLGELQTTLASISAEIEHSDALRQAVADLRSVREGLEAYQVEYKTLEQLGLSLLRTMEGAPTDSLRKLNYLNDLLGALSKRSALSFDEQRSLDLVRRLLQLAGSDEKPSDKDFSEAFISQLMGPLSRKMIRDRFRSEAMPDGFDWTAMAEAFRRGEYNDLLVQSALRPYIDLMLNTSLKPKDRKDPMGPTVVISEQEPDLEQARDLSNFQAFYRDGSPTEVDLLKYLSGDMLEWVYREEITKPDPKVLHPKKVTYILYDISTSMNERGKFKLATAMILAYLDRSQIEVRTGKAEHTVYTMAFNHSPHEPERIGSLAQAQETFERIRNKPLSSEGSTEITSAIVDVYNRIQKHQAEGGELDRANILLITDAEDTIRFDEIQEARDKIRADLPIRFNAITLGDLQGDIQKLTAYSGGEGNGKLGDVGQRHIDYTQIQQLMNQALRVAVVEKSVAAFRTGDQQQLANTAVIDLKNKLVLLESNRDSKDASKLSLYSRFDRLLHTSGPAVEDPALVVPIQYFRRLASGRTAMGWTRAERLENLWGFLTDLAQAIGSDAEKIADSLSESQRASLRTWLH